MFESKERFESKREPSSEATPIEDLLNPKDSAREQVVIPERLEVPKDGDGMFLHFKGGKYPMKGYPNVSALTSASQVKKVIAYSLDIIAESFWLILPLLALKRKKLLALFIQWLDKTELAKHFLVPNRYCKSGRELYRVMESVLSLRNIHRSEE